MGGQRLHLQPETAKAPQPATKIFLRLMRDRAFWLAVAAMPACLAGLACFAPHHPRAWRWYAAHASSLALVTLVSPLLEEIVFRGLLQEFLARHLDGRSRPPLTRANILTSVVFSLFHLLHKGPLWAAGVFAPSLVFGYFRDKYDSILPSILLHVLYNGGFFLFF